MNLRYTPAVLAILTLGSAHADEGPSFKFSGFGTLAAVHSSERNADFIGSAIQPNGAGHTSATSFAPDSKLGVQANANYDKWSAVVQLVSQHQYDNTWEPAIEWANISYQLTPELNVRVGRISLASFAASETRLVGYAQTLVRPPLEVYGLSPFTSNDGIDLSYRRAFGDVNNTFQTSYGNMSIKLPNGGNVKVKADLLVSDTVETGPWSARFSYAWSRALIDISGVNTVIGGLGQFAAAAAAVPVPAFQTAAAQAAGLYDEYRSDRIRTKIFAIGATYDPGNWFVSGEWVSQTFSRGVLSDAKAWYLSGGYRFGSFTPYTYYASTKPETKPDPVISTDGADALAPAAAALTGGVKAVVGAFVQRQSTVAVGLRWDFMPNVALKAQYDRVSLGAGSAGHLVNLQPGFVPGGKVNLVTVALDFVF